MAQQILTPEIARAQALKIKRQREAEADPNRKPDLPLFEEYPNDPASWIERHFYIPETPDHRTILMPYQRACLNHALQKDSQGNFPYSLILWSDIKKSIKSMLAGAVALWMAFNTPWGSIKIVANDLKQADSREAFYIRRAIELNPEMRKIARVKPSGYLIELPNHARIESIPVDPKGEAGGNDDMICFVELWAANNEAAQRMWCYDDQTEILTRRGWVFGKDLLETDIVAIFDDQTEKMGWERPRTIFKAPYQGEMHLYESNSFSQLVTPEHRLFGKFSYNGKGGSLVSGKRYNYTHTGIMRSSELRASGYRVYQPRTSVKGYVSSFVEPEYKSFPGTRFKPPLNIKWEDWCEFMGWFASEGNVKCNRGKPYTTIITQSPEANPVEWGLIKQCLIRCFGENGFSINYGNTSFRINYAPLAQELFPLSGSYNKRVPDEIKESSPKSLRSFLSAFIMGDGGKADGAKSWVLYTHSKLMSDDLMEIGIKLGYSTSLGTQKQPNGSIQYRTLISDGKDGYTRWLQRDPKKGVPGNWKTIHNYDGVVWCPSVSTGLIIVRRHGKVCVSGNTEMTVSPTKYGKSFRWVETYAGFNGKSALLEQLYDVGVKDGDRKKMRPDWAYEFDPKLDIFINPITRTFNLWNTYPRCPWQTPQYYCLPLPDKKDELKVLTEGGWVPAEDITVDHKICTQNQEGVIEYQQPTSIFKDRYDGDLLRLKHTKADIVMTPNHRVFGAFASHTRKVKGMLEDGLKFEYKTATEASKIQVGWIPGHGKWEHEPLKEVKIENETYNGDDFVEFMAWYLSEGNVRADRRNPKVYYSMLGISQNAEVNPEKYARIDSLLTRMGVRYSRQKSGFTVFNARLCRYVVQFGFSHNKFIPRIILDQCSQYQLNLFLETYRDGDGSTVKYGDGMAIYTNSDQMALDIMECGFKAGYRPKMGGSYSSAPEKGRLPIHHIRFMKSHIGWSLGDRRHPWTTEKAPENCVVWCPSLPNGNFYVMQGKTCYWTGNSEEQAILLPSEFNRVHRNQWSAPSDAFCPVEWWNGCAGTMIPDKKEDTHIIAMDAAVDGDTFGLLMISGNNNDNYYVRYARAWKPKIGEHINFSEVEAEVNRLLDEYNVAEVCYDPYQLEDMSQRLRQSLKAHLFQFNQGTPRLIADKALRDIIRDRRMHHDGDLELKDHVINADAKSDGDKLRIVKRSTMLKIDLCVCLSMATARAVYWQI